MKGLLLFKQPLHILRVLAVCLLPCRKVCSGAIQSFIRDDRQTDVCISSRDRLIEGIHRVLAQIGSVRKCVNKPYRHFRDFGQVCILKRAAAHDRCIKIIRIQGQIAETKAGAHGQGRKVDRFGAILRLKQLDQVMIDLEIVVSQFQVITDRRIRELKREDIAGMFLLPFLFDSA